MTNAYFNCFTITAHAIMHKVVRIAYVRVYGIYKNPGVNSHSEGYEKKWKKLLFEEANASKVQLK